jgi:hypothetical protein
VSQASWVLTSILRELATDIAPPGERLSRFVS